MLSASRILTQESVLLFRSRFIEEIDTGSIKNLALNIKLSSLLMVEYDSSWFCAIVVEFVTKLTTL